MMSTVHICFATSLPPDRVLYAAYDFTERRALIWPAVSVDRLTLHEIGENWADVTEGTRVGPIVNWERCRYDWSNRGCVTATVTDSNVYSFPGSRWELSAASTDGGTQVTMTWVRRFRSGAQGRLFGTLFRVAGQRLFGSYARDAISNLETLERSAQAG